MANLKIDIPVRVIERREVERMRRLFRGIEISWKFYQKESVFRAKTTVRESFWNSHRHEMMGIKRLLSMFPNNEKLKEDLERCKERAKKDVLYDVTISFEGEIAAEIDIEHDSILHYTGPLLERVTHRDVYRLKKFMESDSLEEFYHDRIKRLIVCVIMASVFSDPSMRLGYRVVTWIDGIKYKEDSFVEDSLHIDAFRRYKSFMVTKLPYSDAFHWIKRYTMLQEDDPEVPVPFTMLTYLFNRESHESLLYSVIGLENLYSAKGKNISELLHKRIAYVFPQVSREQVNGMYSRRSDFVHGKIKIPIYKDYSRMREGEFYFDDATILGCALLLETMRKLAANNATRIMFDVYCSYRLE